MKTIRLWLFTTIVLVLSLAFASVLRQSKAAEQSADEPALQIVIESFYVAYEKGDLAQMMEMWSKSASEYKTSRQGYEKQLAEDQYRFAKPSISRVKVTGEKASLRVRVEATITKKNTNQPTQNRWARNVDLIKEDGQWKITRDTSAITDLADSLIAVRMKEEKERKADQERMLAAEPELDATEIALALRFKVNNLSNANQQPRVETLKLARSLAEKGNDTQSLNLISRTLVFAQWNYAATVQQFGNLPLARSIYQESLALAESLNFSLLIASNKLNLGILEGDEGNLEAAIAMLQDSQETFKQTSTSNEGQRNLLRLGNTSSWHHLGMYFLQQGELSQAQAAYEASLALDISDISPAFRPNSLHHLGVTHLMQGDSVKAADYFDQALKLFEKNKDTRSIGDVSISQGILLTNDGSDYKDQYSETGKNLATEKFKEAIKKFENVRDNPKADPLQKSKALNGLGSIYGVQDKPEDALEQYLKSEELSRKLGSKSDMAHAQLSLGQAYYDLRQYNESLEHARQSITLAEQVGVRDTLWRAHCVAGLALRALAQPEQAKQEFIDSIRIIEDLRTKVAVKQLDIRRYLDDKVDPYKMMVELFIEKISLSTGQMNKNQKVQPYKNMTVLLSYQKATREALEYAERAKARTLLDIIRSNYNSPPNKETSQEQQEQEKYLRNRFTSISNRLRAEREKRIGQPAPDKLKELESEEENAKRDYERLVVSRLSPKSKTLRGEAPTFSMEDALLLLPNDQHALLEFVTTEEKTVLFVLTRLGRTAQLKAYSIPIKKQELAEKVAKTLHLFVPNPLRNGSFRQPLRDLYETLLRPAQKELRGKKTLVISPDGPLWNVPFQALMPSEKKFLLEEAAVSYTPSLTILREFTKTKQKTITTPSLLAVGNPILGATPESTLALPGEDTPLKPMPESEGEVKEILKRYSSARSKSYIGAEADKDVIKSNAAQFAVLHFSTHGIFNLRNPMSSYLVLSQADKSKDGFLQAREFIGMNLQADLAVLSACKTALGRIGAGEGVIGFSWALFTAGVPTTVVSQWEVDAASTADLMIKFHAQLRKRNGQKHLPTNKAEALRQASLAILKSGNAKYRHPYYWAGFILVGNGF